MRHALIVGGQGVGKSTLIARVRRELALPEAGIETVRETALAEDRGAPVYIYRVGCPRTRGQENLAAFVGGKGRRSFPETFDRYAAFLKEDCARAGLIVLDELGFLESDAATFCGTVLDLLDGDIPVLAAVKPKDTPFLAAVRHHPKAEIFTVDESNRDVLAGQVLAFLRGQLN
ncbi:MAG: nucleoside-triphosphatase [Oscillospiraceae bacterium]|nr:nucleoside-triphosphatase [Oscillospiraceae bacterium]